MAAAALQRTPITFQCRSTPSSLLCSKPTTKLFLSSNLKIPKLTIKPLLRRRFGGGGAVMASDATGSYANALADVAESNDTLDQTYADIEKLEKIFSDESVLKFFTDPTIDDEEKSRIVDRMAKSSDLQPHVENFVNILVDMKRIDLIREIAKEFEVVYNKMTETELAIVTSVMQMATFPSNLFPIFTILTISSPLSVNSIYRYRNPAPTYHQLPSPSIYRLRK